MPAFKGTRVSRKKYACIDIGSNSIRLLIAEVENGKLVSRTKKLITTRLGKDVAEKKMLDPHRMIDSLNAIDRFYHDAITDGCEEVFMYATSAVRDAYNGIDFRQMVFNKTEREFDIISGTVEAKLGFYGAQSGCNVYGDHLIIDIGGGSTEFIYGSNKGMVDAISLDIGSVRLFGNYIKNDPVTEDEIAAVSEHIRNQLRTVLILFGRYPITSMAGIGGTVTAFSSMVQRLSSYEPEKIHGSVVKYEEVRELNAMLQGMTLAQRERVVGLEPRRADIIECGGLILQHSMEAFEIDRIMVSDYDNLEGYLLRRLQNMEGNND